MFKFRTISMPLKYLGTAFASNILDGNITYKKDLYNRLTGYKTIYDSEGLVNMLSTKTEYTISTSDDWYYFYLSCNSAKVCCNTKNACVVGTFESIFFVMKDSIPAHVIHKVSI